MQSLDVYLFVTQCRKTNFNTGATDPAEIQHQLIIASLAAMILILLGNVYRKFKLVK